MDFFYFSLPIGIIALILIAIACYFLIPRRFCSTDTVAQSYDNWTDDGILEYYWGEHIHLGHYGSPPRKKDFLEAKSDFVHEMVQWGRLDQLPEGTTALDVGCGIGGSSRILAKDYKFKVTGISISPQQIKRATELTPDGVTATFEFANALALPYSDSTFDVVWSIEAGPHMPDKAKYASEMIRVLKPGGTLVVADWNQKDNRTTPFSFWETLIMRQLLDQWSHPSFSSIESFSEDLENTCLIEGKVETADWSEETMPSWLESIWEGLRRPRGIFTDGFRSFVKALREAPTFVLMRIAFGSGLCRFGMFCARKAK